jgi:DNA polymerase-3 subunit alpha
VALPDAPPWTEAQQLVYEKEALGFYMSGHPLERHAQELKVFGARRLAELTTSEADIWVGGIVASVRPLKTKKGDRMAVFMLEDIAGGLEVVVFPETFSRYGSLIEVEAMLLVRGKLEKDDESARIIATELQPIAALRERTTREVVIHLQNGKQARTTFEQLAELLDRHRGDRRVFLELDVTGQERALRVRSEVAQRVKPSERLVTEVEQLCGSGSVELR